MKIWKGIRSIMKILMLFIIGINSAFYLYFLFKEMKKYRELVIKNWKLGAKKKLEVMKD